LISNKKKLKLPSSCWFLQEIVLKNSTRQFGITQVNECTAGSLPLLIKTKRKEKKNHSKATEGK